VHCGIRINGGNCKDTQEFGAKDVEELANLAETHVIFQKAYAIGGPVLNLVSPRKQQTVGSTSRRVFYG
jgi:hypothetical protein